MQPDQTQPAKRVTCLRCGAQLGGRAELVDGTITCPDCGARFSATKAPRPVELAPQIDEEWLEMARAPDPVAIEPVEPPPRKVDCLLPQRELMRAEMPTPPEYTFWSGVFHFPWYATTLGPWMAMSVGLIFVGTLLGSLIGLMSSENQFGIVGGGFFGLSIVFAMALTVSYCCACFLATLQSTADGFDIVREWPDAAWKDWFFTSLGPLYMLALSGMIGYLLTVIFEPETYLVQGVITFIVFPILLLSSLEADSLLLPVSRPILRTLRTLWWGWIVFYFETALVVGSWLTVAAIGAKHSMLLTIVLSGPVVAAILLIYARLLGRLAWRAAAPK